MNESISRNILRFELVDDRYTARIENIEIAVDMEANAQVYMYGSEIEYPCDNDDVCPHGRCIDSCECLYGENTENSKCPTQEVVESVDSVTMLSGDSLEDVLDTIHEEISQEHSCIGMCDGWSESSRQFLLSSEWVLGSIHLHFDKNNADRMMIDKCISKTCIEKYQAEALYKNSRDAFDAGRYDGLKRALEIITEIKEESGC